MPSLVEPAVEKSEKHLERIDWSYALLLLGVLATLGQTRLNSVRLKRMQIQMRALLRHIDVVDPTALPTPSAHVREALELHGKFAAIRKYLDETGLSIGECKEAVDELQEDAGRARRSKK